MAKADLIALRDETFDTTKPLTVFHPIETWKHTTFTKYTMRNLMVEVFKDGKQVYFSPTLKEIAEYAKKMRAEFWSEYTRSSVLSRLAKRRCLSFVSLWRF